MVEVAATGVAVFGAFLAAEYLRVSGVLATLSAGLLMGSLGIRGNAAKFGLSAQARTFVLELSEFAAFMANSPVFLLIGLAVARVRFEKVGWGTLAAAIMPVLVGRAATVYRLSQLFVRSRWKIAVREQHVLWWGGLRGTLALALALSRPAGLALRDSVGGLCRGRILGAGAGPDHDAIVARTWSASPAETTPESRTNKFGIHAGNATRASQSTSTSLADMLAIPCLSRLGVSGP